MDYKDISERQAFQFVGTTVYQLEFDGWRKGEAQMRNRVYTNVSGYRDTPVEELEATARLFAAAPDLLEALQDAKAILLQLSDSGYDVSVELQQANKAIAKSLGE